MIKIYDTMSRDLREFVPIEDGKVKMYVCGPTVYNYIHVGNARSTVAFDTIRRYFEYRGYEVAYISNFTDVDDKIINRAKEEGITPQEVAEKYIAAFREDVTALGVKPATRHPRVVEFMADIIRFVEDLIEKVLPMRAKGMFTSVWKNPTTMPSWLTKPWKTWSWVLQVVPMKKQLARKIL